MTAINRLSISTADGHELGLEAMVKEHYVGLTLTVDDTDSMIFDLMDPSGLRDVERIRNMIDSVIVEAGSMGANRTAEKFSNASGRAFAPKSFSDGG